jgi:hypothetical protein
MRFAIECLAWKLRCGAAAAFARIGGAEAVRGNSPLPAGGGATGIRPNP